MARKRAEKTPEAEADAYGRHKADAAGRSAAKSRAGRDIGDLPPVANPERKAVAEFDFRAFCDGYFPQTFSLPWSGDHLKVIAKIERAVLEGGLFAIAMPRGSGKSSLCIAACVHALVYGHREFICLIGSDEGHAADMLDSIKIELETNDLLSDDFPEVCYPIRCLEGIANRCAGQLQNGERTHITWTAKEVVLPNVVGSPAAGSVVRVAGITGRIRGMSSKRPDGRAVRPDLVVIDDPQTDEASRSPSQCATRESILAGAVLGLAGPGKKIAGVMPCTVITPGDMADNILDRQKHPEWGGERMKLVYNWPDREDLWKKYGEARAEELRADGDGSRATAFYAANRAAMDAGAVVAWPERHNEDELSAIQHAWNLRLRDEAAFMAEYQNEPLKAKADDEFTLTAEFVAAKTNRVERGGVPQECVRLTAFVDVQQAMLYYAVCAWSEDFTGYVVDYGTYPDQHRPYFTLRDAKVTLAAKHPGGVEASIYAGLEAWGAAVLGRTWRRDDGAELRVERCLIDSGWAESTNVVYQWCRQSAFPLVVMPSKGVGIGASRPPMSEWGKKPGERSGPGWRIRHQADGRAVRHVIFDANLWKTFVAARLAVPIGGRGCLSLFGDRPADHRLFAEHLTAEKRVRVEARGQKVDEWQLPPSKPDNHWGDAVVGAAVAASIQGCVLPDVGASPSAGRRERVSFAEMQRRKRGGR